MKTKIEMMTKLIVTIKVLEMEIKKIPKEHELEFIEYIDDMMSKLADKVEELVKGEKEASDEK